LNDWPLNDPQFMPAITACLAAITLVLLIAFLKTRVRRAEFARLQQDAKELLELVKELQVAEQIRFLKEINVAMKDGEVPSTILSFPNTA
jgi:hypothetical protein